MREWPPNEFECVVSHEESNSTANSSGRKFLYNAKGLDVISLQVKYYVPLGIGAY